MARHYSSREFFRQMPNKLLERFFHRHDLFHELDFNSMKETKPVELFDAWLALPEKQRHTIDTVLQEIYEISCEKGSLAIIDEARWQMQGDAEKLAQFTEELSQQPSHYHRAMIVYLDYSECWQGATYFYYADTLNYWRKRKHMGHNPAVVDTASGDQLASLICHYFHHTEGRGKNCEVEVFKRGELDYFFAYPEDFSQQAVEWVNGEFGRRPHNPAFEIVFIYSQKDGTLDIHFTGSNKAVEPLQGMFATAILKLDELPPNPKDNRVYDLNPLRDRDFSFTYKMSSGVSEVAMRKIRLSSCINQGERITLEADVSGNKHALYDQLEKLGRSVRLNLYNVTQVELVATMMVNPNKPPKKLPIRLTYPNSCSLKYDDTGLKLREMLSASGIEPKEAATTTGAQELAET
jgi:hypothetical protein